MSASNIVPYYSSSPPPLDEDDDTAHSLDDNDDEFGDFSSAPTSGGIPTVKAPANESAFFRPISENLQPDPLNDDHFEEDYQSNEPPPISVAKDKPVSSSPVFSNDQFAKDHQKDDLFPDRDDSLHSISVGWEQVAIDKIAADERKMSPDLNCQKEKNKFYAQNEKTSDLCNSADFDGEYVSHRENPVRNVEFEHDVLAAEGAVTNVVSINSLDTTEPDVLKDSSDLHSVQDTNKQVIVTSAEDEFDDFETFQGDSALKDSQLESVVSEHDAVNAKVSANGDQENFVVDEPDDERVIKSTNDCEKFEVDDDEFDDFEYFPDEFQVRPDAAVGTATSTDTEIPPEIVQDNVVSDTADSDGQINAADDFDEFESAQELDKFEFCQQTAAEESHLDSVVSKADSSDAEKSNRPDDDEITADTPREDMAESLESRPANESTEETSFKNEIGDTKTSNTDQPEEFKEITSSSADDKVNDNCDFDEFEEFQIADDKVVNPPSADAKGSISGSVAVAFKTDDSSSSWSAFSKESTSDVASEGSWAAFNADSNVSSDLVRNAKQTTASTGKTPTMDWKESSTKSTVDESQVEGKFELLTSRVVTNCYPLVREKDILQLQLLLDVISQTQDLTNNSSESPSIHTATKDPTAGENKSGLPDVCVWNNLKTMDLTSAFGFQWPTSSISRNLLSSINVDLSSILVGHKKPHAPLFAPNLGLLEPSKAPTELQIAQADKDPLTFAISDSSSSSSATMSSAFSPQDVPQLEFDWGGSGLTNPLDATEKERELLDALEPPANESSMKMPPMSLETMLATLLPSIPSTQRIPKSEKDIIDRKHLSEEAIQVLSKLPDLSFMQAKVLMFPLKDIAGS